MMQGALPDVAAAIGKTAIVKIQHLAFGLDAHIYVKCEYLNPGGSHKDRVALSILRNAEETGLQPGGTIVEATSGNTGASLAMLAASRGYKCIFVMPDKMSREKIATLEAFGAHVVVCPTDVEPADPRSYYSVAKAIAASSPDHYYANQYHNPANPEAHFKSTGPEIWEQTGGNIDVLVAGMGTGGTISGAGRFLKEMRPSIRVVGVDPVGSLYYDLVKSGKLTQAKSYKVEGIGEDFIPSTMNLSILDDVVQVDDRECFLTTRDLVRREGLFVGGSSGAAVAGALKYARAAKRKENVVVMLADGANKYLSKVFDDGWMRANGFLEEQAETVGDLLAKRGRQALVCAHGRDSVGDIIQTLKRYGISQLPVIDDGQVRGVVIEGDLLRHVVQDRGALRTPVETILRRDYVTVTRSTALERVRQAVDESSAVLAIEGNAILGVITKIDVIDYVATRAAGHEPAALS